MKQFISNFTFYFRTLNGEGGRVVSELGEGEGEGVD
jgi:hypothetical protein